MEAEDKEEEEEDLFGTVYASTAAGLVETDEPGSASTVARSQQSRAWRWRASPSSPRKLSCRQQRGRGPNRPTLYQDQSRRRGSAWTVAATRLHTNTLHQSYEVTRSYPYLSVLATILISTNSYTLSLPAWPHQNSSLQPFICLCHVASHPSVLAVPSITSILLDSPLSPTPWVVAPRAAGEWGNTMCRLQTHRHDGGHRGKGRGSCHLYGSLPAPSYRINGSRMLCGIGKRIGRGAVSRGLGQSQASARCSLGTRYFPTSELHCTPKPFLTLWTGCKIVHARVRWLGRMGVIEDTMFMLD